MARPRLSDNKRLELLKAGVEGFIHRGYHGTGIKEVLDAVGVPKGSFYNYFGSKEEFGAAAIEYYSECLAQRMEDAYRGKPSVAGLRRFFKKLMSDFEEANFVGGCLVANLGGELEGSEICRMALSKSWSRWRSGIALALANGQTTKELRTDIKPTEMADILIDAWEGAVIRMKIERSLKPLKNCLKRVLGDYLQAK